MLLVGIYKDNINMTMKLLVFVVALLSHGLGAPAPSLDLDKRRESTPEIVNLEKELKKAAGENKQYFSNPNGQPIPQIDGLDVDNEELQKSVEPGQPMGSKEEEMENALAMGYPMDAEEVELANQQFQNPMDMGYPMRPDLSDGDNQDFQQSMNMRYPIEPELEDERLQPSQPRYPMLSNRDDVDPENGNTQEYMAMWKLFKQHPEFMEEVYDYLNAADEDTDQRNQVISNYMKTGSNKRGEAGVYAYPGQNDILEKIHQQGDQFDQPSDDEEEQEEDEAGMEDDDDDHFHPLDDDENEDSHNMEDDIDDEENEDGDDNEGEDDEEDLLHLPNQAMYHFKSPYDGDIAVPPHAM